MNQLIRSISLLASSVAFIGIVTTAAESLAQAAPTDADLNFQGFVGQACVFTNIVDGVLEYDGARKLSASLVTGTFSGTPGSLHLECSGPAEVSIGLPQDNGSATDLITTANNMTAGFGYLNNALAYATQTDSLTTGSMPGPIDETYLVGMSLTANSIIPDGTYGYTVVVTATPQ